MQDGKYMSGDKGAPDNWTGSERPGHTYITCIQFNLNSIH